MRKKALICGKLAVEVTKVYRSCSALGFYFFFLHFPSLHSILPGSYILSPW